MGIWPLSSQTLTAYLLVLARFGILLFMLPFFSARNVAPMVKAALAVILAIVLFPVLAVGSVSAPATVAGLGKLVAAEVMVGVIIALTVQVFFEGVRLMGQLVGFQTGLSIANIIDPQSGAQASIFANFAYFLAMVFFLAFNGHHILIQAVKESFEVLPVGSLQLGPSTFSHLLTVYGSMFAIAIKIGAPAIAALLFTKVAFGLIVRLIPQMNIMIVALPAQVVIGLIFFGICLNVLFLMLQHYLSGLNAALIHVFRLLGV